MTEHAIEEWKEESIDEFLSSRADLVGGSDLPDVLGVGDYGCKRRFFLSKLGLLPRGSSHHLERGRFLEVPIAELYASRTGRKVERVGGGYPTEKPFLRPHADRLVWRPGHQKGVLEIKCPAQGMFRKIQRTGLPESWIVQLQYQMACYGVSWGSFAVYWADGHELEWFDLEAEPKLQTELLLQAEKAWLEVKLLRSIASIHADEAKRRLPPVLDEHSKACARCPAFDDCHAGKVRGDKSESRPEMEAFVAEFEATKKERKDLEARESELKDMIKDTLGAEIGTIRAGKFTVSIVEVSRESFDAAQAKKDLGERAQKYVKFSHYERMTVKVAK